MTAIAWSLVGLMAGSLGVLSAALFAGTGRLDAMHAPIDTLGSELRAEIRDLRGEMHQLG